MKRYFLVDCNNFYASCERVFDPRLIGKPVIVLSSNDACVIARSNEAKTLGICMGQPLFEIGHIVKRHNVQVYSSNFALYGDMSSRVMQTLTEFSTNIEIYSVDEAFLHIPTHTGPRGDMHFERYGRMMRAEVKKRTGIPVSIGIGPTKTLAKAANKLAKKNPIYQGVFDITNHPQLDELLASIDVGDVWGIGYRYAKMLKSKGVLTAYDFKLLDEKWVRKHMTIVGLKTLLELRGVPCLSLDEVAEPKQTICVSRMFGKSVTDKIKLREALAAYMSTAAEKLRAQGSIARCISIFVVYTFYHDHKRFYVSSGCELPIATAYTPDFIDAAHECLEGLYRSDVIYKKVGVILSDISPAESLQMSTVIELADISKQGDAMRTVDKINRKLGRDSVIFASAGFNREWKMKQAKKSQRFTTDWHELLTIEI